MGTLILYLRTVVLSLYNVHEQKELIVVGCIGFYEQPLSDHTETCMNYGYYDYYIAEYFESVIFHVNYPTYLCSFAYTAP